VHRFLSRVWTAAAQAPAGAAEPEGDPTDLLRKAHWAIDKVTRDMQGRFAFNTAIAAVMELVNEIYRTGASAPASHVRFAVATAGSLIFPFAPHLGAEVYEQMTGERVWEQPWPQADPALLGSDEIQLVVQLNGKVVDKVPAPAEASREQLEEIARASGKLVAQRGAVVVCGGLGGAMEAACRGAKQADGLTVGILPGSDRSAANPFVDVALPTGLGEARNALVVGAADVVIAVGRGYGTLSEIALALRAGKRVIGLDTWEVDGVTARDGAEAAVSAALS
jgi:uncharacterized protein (TIGR00725 family)